MRQHFSALRHAVPVAAALALALAGCGSAATPATDAASPAGSPAAAASTSAAPSAVPVSYPLTVKGGNGAVTLAAHPHRIVSMSPTATEMLFAIGAGKDVVAADDNSNYPAEAPKTKLSAFQPNAEAVAGYTPDLVVASNDSNGFVAGMTKLKIPVLLLPAATGLDDTYAQLATLGQVTDHVADAATVTGTTKSRIAAAIASIPAAAKGEKVYHELDPTYYSVTSSTFIGGLYKQMGLTDIADTAKTAVSTGGYPQLSAEFVVTSAPDVIVLADTECCKQDPAAVAKRAAFGALPAVKNHKVISVNGDIASRWGPRVADFAEAIAKALQS